MSRPFFSLRLAALALALLPLALTPSLHAAASTDDPHAELAAPAAAASREDTLYAAGNKAMNEQRWSDAVHAFDQVIAAKGSRADAALYWKAYSLQKLSRPSDSAAVCNQLRAQFPSSTWNHECSALDIRSTLTIADPTSNARMAALARSDGFHFEVGGNPLIMTRESDDPNADIKLLALNGVMHQDPARGITLLRTLLASDNPPSLKQHALFMLGQSKSPDAQALLTEVASGKSNPALQIDAIHMLALSRGKQNNAVLTDVYRGSTDRRVKQAVISALFVSHDAPRLVELARAEKDLDMKRQIVSQLSIMQDPAATDYMLELLK